MKATILAGGKGERLKPITNNLPKPMIQLAGKPLLQYQLELFKKHGINEILISLCYLPEKIINHFGNGEKFGINIKYSLEKEPLGTAGSLQNNPEFFNETFIVMYGDNITNLNLKKLLEFHKKKKALVTIALEKRKKEQKSSSFVLSDKNNKILEFVEKPTEEDNEKINGDFKFVNAGIYVLEPEVLKVIPKRRFDFAYDLFPLLIRQGKPVYAYPIEDEYWYEIGKMEKYLKAKEDFEVKKIKLF